MVKWFRKILFLVFSFSFFIAAIEMDFGECHHTFFDEYDTYVKREQITLDHTVTIQQQSDYALIDYLLDQCKALIDQTKTIKRPQLTCNNHYTLKLFLRNSVWRI